MVLKKRGLNVLQVQNLLNVVTVLEHNEEQGAWGSEKRFIIKDDDPNMPVGVRRNLTAGYKGCFGRINCKELYDEIID